MAEKLGGLTILGYLAGALILLVSLSAFVQLKILSGIFYAFAGALITPIIFHTITKNTTLPLTRGARVVMAIVFIAIAGFFYW